MYHKMYVIVSQAADQMMQYTIPLRYLSRRGCKHESIGQ